jgi:predicted enzyme related to lactoylglutathione lyase
VTHDVRSDPDRLVHGPAHRAGAGRWTAGHDLAGGLLARAGHRGEAAEVTAAGATVKEPARDVGGGRLVATVTDPDGNVLGLLQDP